MENMKEMQNRIKQNKFIKNNGTVLRAINMLRYKYIPLVDLKYALEPNINEAELIDSVNYLSESGFVELRHIGTKAEASLADMAFEEIEAKLSADGIKLLAGKKTDECIEA